MPGPAHRLYTPLRRNGLALHAIAVWLLALPVVSLRARRLGLRALGYEIEPGARVSSRVTILGRALSIHKTAYLNSGILIDASERVTIGPGAHVAPGVKILTSTHRLGGAAQRAGTTIARPIEIGTGAWIGGGAVILDGVTIGSGCIVGAGAVVNKDCLPNGVYVGVPARRVRDLPA